MRLETVVEESVSLKQNSGGRDALIIEKEIS